LHHLKLTNVLIFYSSLKFAKDHVKGRRSHSALVLRAQEILHEKKVPSEDSFSYLAKVASASSSKQVKKAKIRASISLRAEEFDPRSNIRGRRFRSKAGLEVKV
jgi:hypothetical protein